MAGSIAPPTAALAYSASQALVSSGVSSPKWWKKSGGGSLSGVAGSNATYDAPASPTVAVIRAEEEFWESGGTGTSQSDNSLTLPASSYGTKQAIPSLETADYLNAKITFIATAAFLSNAYNSIGGVNGASPFFLMADGKIGTDSDASGTVTTITLVANDVVEIKFAAGSTGFFSLEFRVNGTLVYTWTDRVFFYNSANVMHLKVGTYGGPGYNIAHPELSANWTGWNYGEAEMTVTTDPTPPVTMVLGTPVVIDETQINVPFTDDADFDKIKVQRCELNTFTGGTLVTYDNQTPDTPFPNTTGLDPSVTTTYYYRAKAKDAAGNYSTNWSNIVSATIEIELEAAFTVPAEIEATDTLIPSAVISADEYEWKVNGVIVSTDAAPDLSIPAGGEQTLVMGDNEISLKVTIDAEESDPLVKTVTVVPKRLNVGNVTEYLLSDLPNGLILTGKVRAVDEAGNPSDWSNTATATVGEAGFFLVDSDGFELIDSDDFELTGIEE